MFPLVVIDASAALALVLAESEGGVVANLLDSILEQNGQIHVPELFWYEVCNGLLSAERRQRISSDVTRVALIELGKLPLILHSVNEEPWVSTAANLARAHELSFYDAAYLELAIRNRAQLKSYDKHLLSLKQNYPDVIL